MQGVTPASEAGTRAAQGAPAPRVAWVPTDLLGALRLVRRHWLTLAGGAVAGMVAMLAVTVLMGGVQYTVTAKMLVNLGPEMAISPLLAAREGTPQVPVMRRPEETTTGVEIFSNPRLMREVIAGLGEAFFADDPPQSLVQQVKAAAKGVLRTAQDGLREATVLLGLRPRTTRLERITLAVASGLRVEPVRRSDIIDLTLVFPDPRAGELILGRFIELALASHVQAYRMPGVTAFFDQGRAQRREALRSAEERLLMLRMGTGTPVWSATEQRQVLIRSESESQLLLRQARANIAAIEVEIARTEAVLADLPAEIETSTVLSRNIATDALRERLVQLQLDLATQQARYGENSPEIGDIRRQVAALVTLLGTERELRVDQITRGVNQLHQTLTRDQLARRIELEGQRSRARQLEDQVAALRAQQREIETAAIEIAQLELETARLRRSLDLYERGYDDARIAEAMEAVQFSGLRVVMPPTAELIPSSPSIRRVLLLGLVGGLALAGLLALLREYLAAQKAARDAEEPA
jgi:uncharacterized protein involved in exopolysaccharide biosynthesis